MKQYIVELERCNDCPFLYEDRGFYGRTFSCKLSKKEVKDVDVIDESCPLPDK